MAETFTGLTIWQDGYALVLELYRLTKAFPKDEQYGLVSQIRRSSNAVIAGIAEAQGRYYYADKVRVLYIARGECCEVQNHILVVKGVEYLHQDKCDELIRKYQKLEAGINAYIASLKNKQTS